LGRLVTNYGVTLRESGFFRVGGSLPNGIDHSQHSVSIDYTYDALGICRYNYGNNGNISSVSYGGGSTVFTYINGRKKTVDHRPVVYDRFGNILEYYSGPIQRTFTYDSRGNLLSQNNNT
jgi:YD repeat-containing protein